MKKPLAVLALGLALSAVSYAGPEQYSGKEMKQVAPAPAPDCPNWSGFYFGGFGGYVRTNVDRDLSLTGGWVGFPTRHLAEEAGSRDLDADGGEAGGLLGYNWQFNHWVIGVEGSGAYLWARDSTVDNFFSITPYRVSGSFQTDYLATFGPRVGYAFCRWLPYVTGGLAVGNLDYAQTITFPGGGPTSREGGRNDDTNVGWMVGGGLEYALTKHWSVRGEYKYSDLGSTSFTTDFGGGGGAPAHQRAELTEHHATVALIFKL